MSIFHKPSRHQFHRHCLRAGVDFHRQRGSGGLRHRRLAPLLRHHLLLRPGGGHEEYSHHLRRRHPGSDSGPGPSIWVPSAWPLTWACWGPLPSPIGVILTVIILGGTVCPMVCNNVAFAYLTVATVNFEEITPAVIGSQLVTFWIGGAVILGGSLFAASIGNKIAAAGHTPEAETAAED